MTPKIGLSILIGVMVVGGFVESHPEVDGGLKEESVSRIGKSKTFQSPTFPIARKVERGEKNSEKEGFPHEEEVPVRLVYDHEDYFNYREKDGEKKYKNDRRRVSKVMNLNREEIENEEERGRTRGIKEKGEVEIIIERLGRIAKVESGSQKGGKEREEVEQEEEDEEGVVTEAVDNEVEVFYPPYETLPFWAFPWIYYPTYPVWPNYYQSFFRGKPKMYKRQKREVLDMLSEGKRVSAYLKGANGVDHSGPQITRLRVRGGGVAIAGPGGVATAGDGGTAIVGPGGTAYTTRGGVAVVGPGGKVVQVPHFLSPTEVVTARGLEFLPKGGRVVALGPFIYHQPSEGSYLKAQPFLTFLPDYNVFLFSGDSSSELQNPPLFPWRAQDEEGSEKRRRPLVNLIKLIQTRLSPSFGDPREGNDTVEGSQVINQSNLIDKNEEGGIKEEEEVLTPMEEGDKMMSVLGPLDPTGLTELLPPPPVPYWLQTPYYDGRLRSESHHFTIPHRGEEEEEALIPTTLILKPVAKAVAGPRGLAIASPVAQAIVRRGEKVSIDYEPRSVAIAGPGGVAHVAEPKLIISYHDENSDESTDQ